MDEENKQSAIIPLEAMSLALKRKARVIEYLEEKSEDMASVVYNLAKGADTDSVKLAAAKDILDRAGFKPVEKSQSVNFDIDLKGKTSPELEEIRIKYEEEMRQKFLNG